MDFIFPRHNGHLAWPCYAETVEDAALEDLFWRKVQTDPQIVTQIVKIIGPVTTQSENELVIPPNLRVSLRPESCGAYVREGYNGLCYLNGNRNDDKRIIEGLRNPDMGGYYLGPLVAKSKGWLPNKVVSNLLQTLSLKLTTSDRFSFNAKSNHDQVFIGQFDRDKCIEAVKNAFPTKFNATNGQWYLYRTEDGTINFGIAYFYDNSGNFICKLPLSAWREKFSWRNKIVYDTLNISELYPLYELNKLLKYGSSQYVIVCDSEEVVDYIGGDHAWVLRNYPVTTYCSIKKTDWSKLQGMTPIIFPDASERGCHEAFRIYEVLEELGFRPQLIMRQKGAAKGSSEFNQDLGRLMVPNFVGCSLPEFAEHCLKEFGVHPPDGVLPKAVSLASLPESDVAPEPLMDGLLDTGELMMIYAWRGVGKSLFAMLLGLCFASGKSALNGSVCPSRKYRVLLLDGEMSSASLKNRGYKLCSGHELPQEAMDALKVRSMIVEKKDLALETEEGLKASMPDLEWAEIIFVDSIFKFFPQAMGSDFERAEKLLSFLSWCKKNKKTLILIDHEGKNRGTPFGTMAKEIGIDVALQLCKNKPDGVKLEVKKARNHAEPSGAYSELHIHTSEKGTSICFQVRNKHKSKTLLAKESPVHSVAAEFPKSSEALDLDEVIMRYVDEHPDFTQTRIAADLVKQGYGGRSTIHSRIKVLSEASKLSSWQRRPKTHKVAGLPASEGDSN